jgi:hypothetical protein
MILLGYILWLALAVYVGRRVFRHVNRDRPARLVSAWGVGILFALLPLWDVVMGLPVTIAACRNRAGLQVYEMPSLPLSSVAVDEYVPTSVCASCREMLRRGLAKEVQVELVANSLSGNVDPLAWVSKPGPTSYSISSRGDPRCNGFFDELARIEPQKRALWKFEGIPPSDDTCIAAQSIERIDAEYRITTRRVVEQHGVATLRVQEAVLTSAHDQRPLASKARVYQMSWLSTMLFGKSSGVPDCPNDEEFEDGTQSLVITTSSLLTRLATQQRSEGSKP